MRSFSFLTTGRVLGDAFMFLLLVTLSRTFGAHGVGTYAFALAVTNLLCTGAEFGLYENSIKNVSRIEGSVSEAIGRFIAARLLVISAVFGAFFAVLPFLDLPRDNMTLLALLGAFAVFNTVQRGINAVFIAREHTRIAAALELSLKGTASLGAIAVIAAGGGLTAAVAAFPIASFVQLLGGIGLLIWRFGRVSLIVRWNPLVMTLREAVPYALSSLLADFNSRMTVVTLVILAGEAAAGVYSVAYRIIFFVLVVPFFARLSLLPLASRLHGEADGQFQSLFQHSVRVGVIVGAPAAVGLFLIAPQLIALLYGPEFAASVPVLRILSVLILLGFWVRILGTFLTASDRQALMTKSQGIACTVNVVLCLVLIPPFGVAGAACAMLAAEGVAVAFSVLYLKNVVGRPRLQGRLLISGVGIAAFCVPFALWQSPSLALIVPCSIILYVLVLLIFPETRNNELRTLYTLVGLGRFGTDSQAVQ